MSHISIHIYFNNNCNAVRYTPITIKRLILMIGYNSSTLPNITPLFTPPIVETFLLFSTDETEDNNKGASHC